MKGSKYIFISIISVVLFMLSGCSSSSLEGVHFNNEAQLKQEGFVSNINQDIYIGTEKVIFQKVAFDRNSITFVYKGNVLLSGSSIAIKGVESVYSQKFFEHMGESILNYNFGMITSGANYHIVTVPNNLKLINQLISIGININGRNNNFNINFPGDKLAASTAEVMADSTGKVVDEGANATNRVIVGIDSMVLESKVDGEFTVVDKVGRKVLRRVQKVSTTGEVTTVFEPLPLPRSEIRIKVLPDEGTVLINYK